MIGSIGRGWIFAALLAIAALWVTPANLAAADKAHSSSPAPELLRANVPDQLTQLRNLDPYCFTALTPELSESADGSLASIAAIVRKDGASVCPNETTHGADHRVDAKIFPLRPLGINLVRVHRASGGSMGGMLTYVSVSVVERTVPVDEDTVSHETLLVSRGILPIFRHDDSRARRMAERWVSATGGTHLAYVPEPLIHLRKLDPRCFAFVVDSYSDPGTEMPGTRVATVVFNNGAATCPNRRTPSVFTWFEVKFLPLTSAGITLVRVDRFFNKAPSRPQFVLVSVVERVIPVESPPSRRQILLVTRARLPYEMRDDESARDMAERWASAMTERP